MQQRPLMASVASMYLPSRHPPPPPPPHARLQVRQGSVEQLAYGTLITILYLTTQLIAAPFVQRSDDYMAAGCSMLMVVLFVCAIIFKYGALTELEDQQSIMSGEQKEDYLVPHIELSAIVSGACAGGLVLLGVIMSALAVDDAQRRRREALAAKARRLHYLKDGLEVMAPPLRHLSEALPEWAASCGIQPWHVFLR